MKNPVEDFENKFAEKFQAKYAVSFLYGRSGLYALLKCLEIRNAEVILPAYTCVVVAHAILHSGNIPCFVDIDLENYNMNLDLLEKAINKNTRAIIATSLFGYPYSVDKLKEIIAGSGQPIVLIQDCAHSFGVEFNRRLICNEGDAALFSLNISKQMSSIFGGMITTNSDEIYGKLKDFQDKYFRKAGLAKSVGHFLYFLSTYATFTPPVYAFVSFLERRTKFMDPFTKYYDSDKVTMPRDFFMKMPGVNAKVGLAQLKKYDEIKRKRIEIAKLYDQELRGIEKIERPLLMDGATYSHYVLRTDDRERLIRFIRRKGVQLGRIIEYAIPYMKAYEEYKNGDYPNALRCAATTINFPNYPGLKKRQIDDIIRLIKSILR